MKLFLLAAASVLASIAHAQVANGVPACAQPCVNKFATSGGSQIAGCNRIDIACICSNKSFISEIACCLSDVCNAQDQDTATQYALAFCKANQVTDLPTAVSCLTASPTGTPPKTGGPAPTVTGPPSTTSGAAAKVATASITGSGKPPGPASTSASAYAAPTNAAGIGAGILGGIAAVVALL